jgi:LacI family transcriptional regulator
MIDEGALQPGDRLPDGEVIGSELGVSTKTVSRALADLGQRGYIERKRRAGTFVLGRAASINRTLGFYYLHEATVFMSKVAEYIQRCCSERGYDLKIVSFDWDFYEKTDLCREFNQRGIQGAIVVPLNSEICYKKLKLVQESGFPYVRFGNNFHTGRLTVPLIRGNDRKRCQEVMEYLWDKGHRRIGLIYSVSHWETETEYLRFYARHGGLEDRWIANIPFNGPPESWSRFDGAGLCREYLDNNPDITAIIVENNAVCMEVLRDALAAGKAVPDDLSLFCLVDWPGMDMGIHPITAMGRSESELAKRACDELFGIMENGYPESEHIVEVSYSLIERGSVSALKLV